jgi:hypothetical protein
MAFIPSNPKLDEVIANSDSFENLRERMKAQLARDGVISRDEATHLYGVTLTGRQETPVSPVPASNFRLEREVRFAESTGKRTLLLKANTIEELDALERQVTGQ